MKQVKIFMVAAISMLSFSLFAQTNVANRSAKERMKMQVVKSAATVPNYANINYTPTNYTEGGLAANHSSKEQLKKNLVSPANASAHHEIVIDKNVSCSENVTYANMSAKEKMKTKVVKLNTCVAEANVAANVASKCVKCGKDMNVVNNK